MPENQAIKKQTASYQADQRHDTLKKMFANASAKYRKSTVRLFRDGTPATLGTVVSEGYVIAKGSELYGTLTMETTEQASLPVEEVAYDEETDLALLKVDIKGLRPIEFVAHDVVTGRSVAVVGPGREPIEVGVISSESRTLFGPQAEIAIREKGSLGLRLRTDREKKEVVVDEIEAEGAAVRAGIEQDDVLVKLAGKELSSRDEVRNMLSRRRAGEIVTMEIRRNGQNKTVRLRLHGKPPNPLEELEWKGGILSGRRTGFPAILQHDGAIRPADCGGPLVDADGNVLGVNIARAGRTESWALPADEVAKAIARLMNNRKADSVGSAKPQSD